MKIYDMHIHLRIGDGSPEEQLALMDKAGVFGACVFSVRPKQIKEETGLDFEERLDGVLKWTENHRDRLFPVLWVHPDEENIINKVRIAAEKGIVAFKIICNNFYVYEEKSMALIREIAKLNKPLIFHTGILWDGEVSSSYNRPVNFEALINIEGLKFSMGHCSWPWIDECVALYGKFQNALGYKNTAEMFFDITPGTPEIWRKELFTKLFKTGYDVGSNIMFGTDCSANSYNSDWAKKWLSLDGEIMNELGVRKSIRENIYEKNLFRFLGISGEKGEVLAPTPDNSNSVSCLNPEVEKIIEKWYKKLEFPKEYDAEFYEALKTTPISDAITLESYDKTCKNGKRNLLSFLYFCEELSKKYEEKGIPEEILLDTLSDIPRWAITHSGLKGELFLGELPWLSNHLGFELFKIGRLQFRMNGATRDFDKVGIKKGDPIMEIHIPAEGKLDKELAKESIARSKEFFKKYFPEYSWEYYTCDSWLLDTALKKYLPENSNILNFQALFEIDYEPESDALLRYLFKWNTNILNLKYEPAFSSLAQKIKPAALSGEKFHESWGFIKK